MATPGGGLVRSLRLVAASVLGVGIAAAMWLGPGALGETAAPAPATPRTATATGADNVQAQAAQPASPAPGAPLPPVAPVVDPCAAPTWVTAWSAPPQDSTAEQRPGPPTGAQDDGTLPQSFDDQTLRMIVSPRTAGSKVRVQLSNRFGRAPVTFGAVRIARHAGDGATVEGTDRPATFGGARSVTLEPGATVFTDEIDLPVGAFDDLAVSVHVLGPSPLDVHLFGVHPQYATGAGAGDRTGDRSGAAFTIRMGSTLAVSAVDVLAPRRFGTVVALGDSLTDGHGTKTVDRAWPDVLAYRVLAERGAPALAFVNAGIGGTQVSKDNVYAYTEAGWGMGPSAVTRLDPDALARAGVTDVIVFVGINDLYMPTGPDPVAAITDGYRAISDRVRQAGLRVIGVTLTPGGLGGEKEAQRQAVNEWIRTSGAYDVVFDFDAVVRDPADPSRVNPSLAADPVHLNEDGYAAVARSVDLGAFQGTGCAAS